MKDRKLVHAFSMLRNNSSLEARTLAHSRPPGVLSVSKTAHGLGLSSPSTPVAFTPSFAPNSSDESFNRSVSPFERLAGQ